jgi:lipid-binding SYLF domain-containing protein
MLRLTSPLKIGITVFAWAVLVTRISYAGEADLVASARETVALYKKADPGLKMFFENAAGYVVFPGVGKAGIGIGGAHGTGVLFENGKPIGKATLNQVTVGAQLGGQEYSEVIFLETPRAVTDFKQGHAAFSAQASAVALKSGASANAKYKDNVAIFTATKAGMMAEASVGGQKFSFEYFPPTH